MGFKSVMKKIGKVALAAAPYVAAPFTGGASLSFAPMANKALSAWNQSDANKAAAKGLAPSSFDRFLGAGADVASMAGGMGAMSGLGKSFSGASFNTPATGKMGTLANVGNQVMDRFGGMGMGGYGQPQYAGAQYSGQDYGGGQQYSRGNEGMVQDRGQAVSRSGGLSPQQLNPMGMMNQNNPNLSDFIGQGRREAINDQPFRRGYEVNYLGSDDETPYKTRMPKIGSVQPERKAKKKQPETVN